MRGNAAAPLARRRFLLSYTHLAHSIMAKKQKEPQTPFERFWRKYLVLTIVVAFFVVLVVAYLFGYRIGYGVTLERVGTLNLPNLPAGTTVYVDQVSRGTESATSSMSVSLVSGEHNVMVSTPGDYPWNDLVSIESGSKTVASPILVPMQPDVTKLSGSAAQEATARIASTTLPTETSPLTLANGCEHVYVSNNQVLADAVSVPGCVPPTYLSATSSEATIIFSPASSLLAVLPYPNRQDALLIGMNNVLYAVTLDPRSPRFFAPVLGGTAPQFGTLSDGTLVVKNGDVVLSVKL